MTIAFQETPVWSAADDIDCVRVLAGPEAFDAINQPDCPAAIWARKPLANFQSWIDCLSSHHLPEGRVILRPDATSQAVLELCEIAQMPEAPERDVFVNDVSTLADLFSKTMDAPFLRLRLEAVKDNGCPKFHTDTLSARLVCTYRGRGTEYGFSVDGDEPRDIFQVPTGSPILMRGKLWPETPISGFKHRSPPIEGIGQTRLVLALDTVSNPDDEVWIPSVVN